MIDMSKITKAVEVILKDSLMGYTISRNEPRNENPNIAGKGKGWIGIYKGSLSYNPRTTGNRPWGAVVEVIVEIQVASMGNGEDVDDKLQAAEQEVMNILEANKNLGGTVDMSMGYDISYEVNKDSKTYHQAALITIKAEVRT